MWTQGARVAALRRLKTGEGPSLPRLQISYIGHWARALSVLRLGDPGDVPGRLRVVTEEQFTQADLDEQCCQGGESAGAAEQAQAQEERAAERCWQAGTEN